MKFSIIMPVYREERVISGAVKAAEEALCDSGGELLVVDGEPAAGTLAVLENETVKKIAAGGGRGAQMNAGAAAARGDALLFLHADTRLPPGALRRAEEALARGRYSAGAFRLKLDSQNFWLKFVAWTANLRNRLTGTPYGDQAIFMKKDFFNLIGGYREIPIMEDLDLMERVKAAGGRIKILDAFVVASPRRWQTDGLLKTTITHHLLRLLRLSGASPEALAEFRRRPGLIAAFLTLVRGFRNSANVG